MIKSSSKKKTQSYYNFMKDNNKTYNYIQRKYSIF